METVNAVLVGIFGLAWGSFLNVVIHRLPRDMSLLKPPSSCPACGRRIRPWDNIPVLSYVFLGGRCRACKTKISPVYPFVELLTATGLILVFLRGGGVFSLDFFAGALFTTALIVLGVIDYFHQILPDVITLPGFALALIYAVFRDDLTLRQALVGAIVGAGFLLFVYGVYFLVRRKEGLGMGDVTMMLMVGAFLGWMPTILTLILASFTGALVGAAVMKFGKKDLQFALPFGTFLAPAAFVAMLWGNAIITAYLSLYP